MDKKILEFEITEKEFDKYVSQGGIPILETTDDYVLYGTAYGADIKFKNEKSDDGKTDIFKIVQIAPEEITCGKCHIKIHTGYYEGCPLCETTLVDLIAANRKYNDELHDFTMALNKEFQDRQKDFESNLQKECGFDF